jgi:hypothetical protein
MEKARAAHSTLNSLSRHCKSLESILKVVSFCGHIEYMTGAQFRRTGFCGRIGEIGEKQQAISGCSYELHSCPQLKHTAHISSKNHPRNKNREARLVNNPG